MVKIVAQNGRQGLEMGLTLGYWSLRTTFTNRVFWLGKNNGGNSGHYVVASRPPNGDRLQRRRSCQFIICHWLSNIRLTNGANFLEGQCNGVL